VQRLHGKCRVLQEGRPPEILNVHRMCEAGSRERSSDSFKDTAIVLSELLADEAWLNQVCIFFII